jgi:hypothetical protein
VLDFLASTASHRHFRGRRKDARLQRNANAQPPFLTRPEMAGL